MITLIIAIFLHNLSAVIKLKSTHVVVTFSKLQFPLPGHVSDDGKGSGGSKTTRHTSFNFEKEKLAKKDKKTKENKTVY